MKSEIEKNEKSKPELKFPCLIEYTNTGNIVLVTGNCGQGLVGTLLNPRESEFGVGYHSENWMKFGYELFDGKITLSN